jgi:putative sigma-54 modulation protein
MNVNIRFKGLDSSEAVKEYLQDRARKLAKFVPPTVVVNATVMDDKLNKSTEINLNFKGINYVAKREGDTLFASIDEAIDTLVRQLSKAKDKKISRTTAKIDKAEIPV